MDLFDRKAVGAAALIVAVLILVAISNQPKVYNIIGDEVISIAPKLPEPYVVDIYVPSVAAIPAVESWDYLVADNTPLLEIEPVEEVIYDYILDEQLTELPPLEG